MIPEIDIHSLFAGPSTDRDVADQRIYEAACDVGFMTITGIQSQQVVEPKARASLLRIFQIQGAEQRKLWKKNFASENSNLYRGWFPLESSESESREGFEIGPDLVRTLPPNELDDLLYEASVYPAAETLPGWREDAALYYESMEVIGYAILASISRGIGIPEHIFRDAFRDGISTLRLLRYPGRDLGSEVAPELQKHFMTWEGERVEIVCGGHVDSGLVTILAQCDADGLQAKSTQGSWLDVPPREDGFVINFGGLLARWTGGRVRATKHRVLSSGAERFSIPFFFEPRPSAVIAPLPFNAVNTANTANTADAVSTASSANATDAVADFAPFQFGDHLWATTTKFPENYGLEHLRPARALQRSLREGVI